MTLEDELMRFRDGVAFVAWAGPWLARETTSPGGDYAARETLGQLRNWREIPTGAVVCVYTHLCVGDASPIHNESDSAPGLLARAVQRARTCGAWIGRRTAEGVAWEE